MSLATNNRYTPLCIATATVHVHTLVTLVIELRHKHSDEHGHDLTALRRSEEVLFKVKKLKCQVMW